MRTTRTIKVVGGKHHHFAEVKEKGLLTPDSSLTLEREPDNVYDAQAIKVFTDGKQIGYVAGYQAAYIAPLLDNQVEVVSCKVTNLGVNGLEAHLVLEEPDNAA